LGTGGQHTNPYTTEVVKELTLHKKSICYVPWGTDYILLLFFNHNKELSIYFPFGH
jgi:hypothetical protein